MGLGNVEGVSLVLNEDGIRVIPTLGVQACTCKEKPAILRGIILLSRLGNEYYLECDYTVGDFDDERRQVLFTLPKSMVVSERKEVAP